MTLPSQALLARWETIRLRESPAVAALALLRVFEGEAHSRRDRDAMALARSFLSRAIPSPLPALRDLLRIADSLPEWRGGETGGLRMRLGLDRPDRAWEKRLIEEGLSRGWSVEALEHDLPLAEVGAFHAALEEKNWPEGVVLRVEPAGTAAPDRWKGRWWLLLSPGARIR